MCICSNARDSNISFCYLGYNIWKAQLWWSVYRSQQWHVQLARRTKRGQKRRTGWKQQESLYSGIYKDTLWSVSSYFRVRPSSQRLSKPCLFPVQCLWPYRWVGYQEAEFEGQQYILEEGEYPHFSDWGGCEDSLLSLRPVRTVSITYNVMHIAHWKGNWKEIFCD